MARPTEAITDRDATKPGWPSHYATAKMNVESFMSDDMTMFSEEERELIRTSVNRLLADKWPALKAVELSAEPAAVKDIWTELESLGVPDLGRDPAMGGLREILLVFEELGRACCPAPLIGAVVANLVQKHVEGTSDTVVPSPTENLYAAGLGAFDGDLAAGQLTFAEGKATGIAHFVEGAATADRFIFLLNEPSGVAIVDASAPGVSVGATPALSLPDLSSVELTGAAATFVPVPVDELKNIAQIVRLATASRALGSGQRGYELVVEHAGTRKQFGKFIGQFQAVQHRLVDNLIRLDGARLTLDAAATAYDQKLETWATFADLALAHLNPGLRQLAIDMHQLMGAIGYSEEHELPRHFRQIHGNVSRFGGAFRARAEIGAYLVGGADSRLQGI